MNGKPYAVGNLEQIAKLNKLKLIFQLQKGATLEILADIQINERKNCSSTILLYFFKFLHFKFKTAFLQVKIFTLPYPKKRKTKEKVSIFFLTIVEVVAQIKLDLTLFPGEIGDRMIGMIVRFGL